ncbi:MAG: S-methyl-5-thioribose-1-phosphate isomerase [Candidatus Brocadiia bacterium]
MPDIAAIYWEGGPDGRLVILDQTRLPFSEIYLDIHDLSEAEQAIRSLQVRGAPLLGLFSCYALALAIRNVSENCGLSGVIADAVNRLKAVRPTAVNVFGDLDEMAARLQPHEYASPTECAAAALAACEVLREHYESASLSIARNGFALVEDGGTYITHCNTGSLAAPGLGTALGILKYAHRMGKRFEVLVCESRPLLQGSRLTAFELEREGMSFRLLCDSAMSSAYSRLGITAALTGADRIAANGDTANKIGTQNHAILCSQFHVPLYVAAPVRTIDLRCKCGTHIIIEQRSGSEVTSIGSTQIAPRNARTYNPAFDITPANMIAGIITEKGLLAPPFPEGLATACRVVSPLA